jgi:hypothetical protein
VPRGLGLFKLFINFSIAHAPHQISSVHDLLESFDLKNAGNTTDKREYFKGRKTWISGLKIIGDNEYIWKYSNVIKEFQGQKSSSTAWVSPSICNGTAVLILATIFCFTDFNLKISMCVYSTMERRQ